MSKSDMTTKRLKEPFDPALDAPIALTPDQIEQVVGGSGIATNAVNLANGGHLSGGGGGGTTGAVVHNLPFTLPTVAK